MFPGTEFRYWWKLQSSPMQVPAAQFLMWRAVGAPALVVALAIQGVFRGFKDTKTPLYATGKSKFPSTFE